MALVVEGSGVRVTTGGPPYVVNPAGYVGLLEDGRGNFAFVAGREALLFRRSGGRYLVHHLYPSSIAVTYRVGRSLAEGARGLLGRCPGGCGWLLREVHAALMHGTDPAEVLAAMEEPVVLAVGQVAVSNFFPYVYNPGGVQAFVEDGRGNFAAVRGIDALLFQRAADGYVAYRLEHDESQWAVKVPADKAAGIYRWLRGADVGEAFDVAEALAMWRAAPGDVYISTRYVLMNWGKGVLDGDPDYVELRWADLGRLALRKLEAYRLCLGEACVALLAVGEYRGLADLQRASVALPGGAFDRLVELLERRGIRPGDDDAAVPAAKEALDALWSALARLAEEIRSAAARRYCVTKRGGEAVVCREDCGGVCRGLDRHTAEAITPAAADLTPEGTLTLATAHPPAPDFDLPTSL